VLADKATGFGDLEHFQKYVQLLYMAERVFCALCFMAAVRGRPSGLPGFGDDRFANPRTAATCFCLATKTDGYYI
jgi:hypothetical protein